MEGQRLCHTACRRVDFAPGLTYCVPKLGRTWKCDWVARREVCEKTGDADMAMLVEIRDGKLCIEIDLEEPKPSASGKTLVVASTRGNAVTDARIDGKPVTIGLNAYIKP